MIDDRLGAKFTISLEGKRPAVTISHLPPEKCSRHNKIPQQLNHFPRAVKKKNNSATILQKPKKKEDFIEDH